MTELKNNQPSSKKWKAGFYIRLSREDVESESSNQTIKTYNKTESEIPSPALYKSSQGITKYIKEYGAKTGWKDSSIRRILTNPLYTGTLVQKFREKINYKIQKFRKVEKDRQIRVENVASGEVIPLSVPANLEV